MATLAQGTPVREFTDVARMRAHYAGVQRRLNAPRVAVVVDPAPARIVAPPPPPPEPADAPTAPTVAMAPMRRIHAAAPVDHRPIGVADVPGPRSGVGAAKRIVAMVARWHDLTPSDLTGPSRLAPIVTARQDAIAALYLNLTHLSTPMIGQIMGGRDHTTILLALRRRGIGKGTLRGRV